VAGRFVLTAREGSTPPATDEVERVADLTVLDASLGSILLVEYGGARKRLEDALPGWSVAPERLIRRDDPRPRVRRAPRGTRER
jgi:hypothetical protein